MAEVKTPAMEKYTNLLSSYQKDFKDWENRTRKILDKYRDEKRTNQSGEGEVRFNILWSNVQTLIPATFSRIPKADVSRRYRDQDDVGRVSSLILERAIEYELTHYPDFRETMKADVQDRFLGGRGTAWARYEPHIRAVNKQLPEDGLEVTEDVDTPGEELDYEQAPVDFVHYKDFGHSKARTWEEVSKVWRRVYMQMPAKVERFGKDTAKKIPKDARPSEDRYPKQQSEPGGDDGSWIYELWDKDTKKVCWFHKSMKDILDERDDPLGLEGFFPCPKPLYATLTNESLVPVPDFTLYQDQAKSLDTLADRIYGLVNMLQVKGVYDGSADKAIGRLFTEGTNGTLIPVKNWAAFAEKNGLKGSVDIMDLDPISRALKEAYTAFGQIIQFIYQITGIADIVRGVSDPNETLGAQEIKKNFVGLRLGDMKMGVAQFATELIQLKAQIMCSQFDPQTILKIAAVDQLSPEDQQLVQPALTLLVGEERMQDPEAEAPNPMRSFRIEVQADSLVQIDEQEEKQSRLELMTAFGTYLEKGAMLIAQAPMAAPIVIQIGKFVLQSFKAGKNIEGTFDSLLDQMKQPQPPKPDPEMAKVEAQKQADQARLQHDQQCSQVEMQQKNQEMQMEAQMKQQEQQVTTQQESVRMQHELALKEKEFQLKERELQLQMEFDKWKAELDAKVQLQIAEVNAEASCIQAEIGADATVEKADIGAAAKEEGGGGKPKRKSPLKKLSENQENHAKQMDERVQSLSDSQEKALGEITSLVKQMVEDAAQPASVIRGPDGRVTGVQKGNKRMNVQRGSDGRVQTIQ
jgi:hypothetical protein